MLTIIAAALALSAAPVPGENLLDKADTNSDGVITRDEARAAREQAFKRADRNSDGVVNDADVPKRAALAAEYRQRTAQLKTQYDANGDGAVTLAEVQNAPMKAFDAADANKDGVVDKSEVDGAKAALKAKRP